MRSTSAVAVIIHAVLPVSSFISLLSTGPSERRQDLVVRCLVTRIEEARFSVTSLMFRGGEISQFAVAGAQGRAVSLAEQRVHELLGVERRKIIRTFTQADQLDRPPELTLDRHHDAALGGPVELGQHD